MTDKNTYWLHDTADTYALATGAEERDRLRGLGYVEADEPADGFVYVWRDGIAEPGRASVDALREVYGPAGWLAGPPPGGKHPVAAVADQPESKTELKPSKSAARGAEKE